MSLPLERKTWSASKLSVQWTVGFGILRLYSSPASDALRLSLADVFRWSTGRGQQGHEDHHLPGPLAPGSEAKLLGLPHTNLGKRTSFHQDIVQRSRTAVIFQLTFLVGLGNLFGDAGWPTLIYLVFEVVSALEGQ